MSKKLFARGSDGLIAICDGALTEAQIDDPLNNLANIWFHSNLEYMNAIKVFTGTAVFPERSTTSDAWVVTTPILTLDTQNDLLSHVCFGRFSDGQLINGFTPIQRVNDLSWRAAGLCVYPGTIKLMDFYVVRSTSLPQISKDYTIYVLSWPDVEF